VERRGGVELRLGFLRLVLCRRVLVQYAVKAGLFERLKRVKRQKRLQKPSYLVRFSYLRLPAIVLSNNNNKNYNLSFSMQP
jgi:hypothetical protein